MATAPVSPFAPITLNGVSQYSSDLQNILNRAVEIADIPLTTLQNEDSDVLSKESLLTSLSSTVSNFADSLTALGTAVSSQGLAASSSDPNVVTATATGATGPVSYIINSVTSAASAASERTLNGYADATSTPVSSTGTMELVVGSQKDVFTLSNNSLVGLRDTINSLNAGVTASILTTSGGNYLSLTANSTGATTLQLIDDPVTPSNPKGANTNILTATDQGANAVFQLNGINVSQSSNTVNSVIPGVTLNIVGPSTTPTTVSLASSPDQLSSALQTFVTDYNALQSAVSAQTGPSAGLLLGDTVIDQLQTALGQVASYYNPTGTVNSLADLGVTFSDTGQASFDPTALQSMSSQQLSDAFNFVGSATTGLASLAQTFSQFSDPISGLITIDQQGLQQTDHNFQDEITTLTDRINNMQTALASNLQQADALLATLQSQQQTLSASLQGLNLVLYGKDPTGAV